MPIYEYICQECGKRYEKFVRSSRAEVELRCPECGSTQAKKAFSVFGTRGSSRRTAGATVPASTACSPVG